MTTTTEASTEAQQVRLHTAEALKLAARAADLSLVVVDASAHRVTLSFRRNDDAATFAERIGAHVDEYQNAGDPSPARWWITDEGTRVVGWGEVL